MKKACLVYKKADAELNKFFINELTRYLGENKISCQLVFYEDFYEGLFARLSEYDVVINRSRELSVAYDAEKSGIPCVNNSKVCEIGNDKLKCHEFMQSIGVPVMETYVGINNDVISTDVYESNSTDNGGLENSSVKNKLTFPFVIKSTTGHGGGEVFIVNNEDELLKMENKFISENKQYVYQKIASDKGRDLRVYIIGGKPVIGMMRTSDTDFRSNFSLGGNAEIHPLTDEEKAIIEQITNILHIDYAGIDLIYDNGKSVLNEVEDMVGARMLYSYTDVNPAKLFSEHILNVLSHKK